MRNDEFYIGWMQKTPRSFALFIQRYLMALVLMVAIVGVLLAANQKKFSNAKFEFGKTTVLEGVYSSQPVPHLRLTNDGKDLLVPLVGYGKHGAEGIIAEVEKEKNTVLEGRTITLKGTLIHGEGKLLLQVDKNEDPLAAIASESKMDQSKPKLLGTTTLKGEVIDPKCYFGVMKPGEGKVHKDCAIRCISGGIPPVLMMTNEKGERSFVLLVGARGKRLNEAVKDFVGISSQVSGELMQEGDWLIMQVATMKNNLHSYTIGQMQPNDIHGMACCRK
jgi:hypothetical protein